MSIFTPLGYHFNDHALLRLALTHPSTQRTNQLATYERLEFLGDSVVGMIVADMLFHHFPDEPEGHLAKRKAGLVNGASLAQLAVEQAIGEQLIISEGEEKAGGRENKANLENAFEAVIGAIYLDSSMENVRACLAPVFMPLIKNMGEPPVDAKTALQECVQAQGMASPSYETLSQEGPAHAPLFVVKVSVADGKSATGEGASKKRAERRAAKALLEILT